LIGDPPHALHNPKPPAATDRLAWDREVIPGTEFERLIRKAIEMHVIRLKETGQPIPEPTHQPQTSAAESSRPRPFPLFTSPPREGTPFRNQTLLAPKPSCPSRKHRSGLHSESGGQRTLRHYRLAHPFQANPVNPDRPIRNEIIEEGSGTASAATAK
jgi:hypothetical protein